MHQLSSDHTLATGDRGSQSHGANLAFKAHGHVEPAPVDHLAGSVDGVASEVMAGQGNTMSSSRASLMSVSTGLVGAGVVAVKWGPRVPLGDDDGCAGCASHLMLMATCLLALTLVVGAWLLLLPTVRLMAGAKARVLSVVVVGRARIRPTLSLVELSLRRT